MRLLPRFSLRFALIALTIFLIVFGVGVKYWREYREHERLAALFQRSGIRVEEEPITFGGWMVGKRMTGLMFYSNAGDLELLRQLPNPRDMRRLSLFDGKNLIRQAPEILKTLALFPELQALELRWFELSTTQLHELQQFQQLEFLTIRGCKMPKDSPALLPELKSLKTLILTDENIDIGLLSKSELPRLEYLELTRAYQGESLELTKTGLGRFPNLRYLVLRESELKQLHCEDNALPQLRFLDLNSLKTEATLPWEELVRLVPNLEALCINVHHIREEAIPALAGWKRLVHLQWDTNGNARTESNQSWLKPLKTPFGPKTINFYKLPLAEKLVKQYPELQVHSELRGLDRDNWRRDYFLPERHIDERFMRESNNWKSLQK